MKKNPLVVIFLTVFIDLVGFGIIIPLSPYLARQFGASPLQVGLLMAIYSAMQFLFAPIWGRLSDRIGRRPVLLVSIAGTVLAHSLFYFSTALWILFLARLLAGLFGANISTAMAYIADVTEQKDRSKNMGLIGAAFGLGFVFGPAIGGVLGTTRFGENFPALVAAMLSLANLTFAFFVLKESLAPENRQAKERKSRLKNIFDKLKRPVIGSLLFAQFATALAMANIEASLFLFVQDRFGWGIQKASFGFAYIGICIALTQGYLVRKFMPRYGEKVMLLSGFVFFTIAMFATGMSQWVWLLGIAMTFLALGNGFINPSVSGSLSVLSTPQEQGEVMGVNQSLASLARIIGPPMGGFLYQGLAQSAPFFAAGVLSICGLAFAWHQRQNLPEAGLTRPH